MSSNLAPHHVHQREHGTTASYITGFILSLVFTVIPYYLVVKHVFTGNMILVVILTFAVLQMLVQILFFLHLGRQKKPNWQLFFFASTIGIIVMVVVASLVIMTHLHANMSMPTTADAEKQLISGEGIYQVDGQPTGACHELGKNHQIIIKDGVATPSHTDAKQCDTLTFINQDNVGREIGFGPHDDHQPYTGVSQFDLHKGHPETLNLSETGTIHFHDHFHEATAGDFTVTP